MIRDKMMILIYHQNLDVKYQNIIIIRSWVIFGIFLFKFGMKNFKGVMIWMVLVTTILTQTSTAPPYFAVLNLNSTQSRTIMQPFLSQNPTIDGQLNNITTLSMNTSFVQLFGYILANSTVYDQLLPNISTIKPFSWTNSMNQSDKQALLEGLLSTSLSVFYTIMMDNIYPANETQCQ